MKIILCFYFSLEDFGLRGVLNFQRKIIIFPKKTRPRFFNKNPMDNMIFLKALIAFGQK